MKLRISGASIRLRLLRSDVRALMAEGRVVETIYLGAEQESCLRYSLLVEDAATAVTLRYRPAEIEIVLPKAEAERWCASEQVGLYGSAAIPGHESVDLIIEKDFACLDLSDAENVDTFPNPQSGALC